MRAAKKTPFQTWRYKLGMKFDETEVKQVKDTRAELRIWEIRRVRILRARLRPGLWQSDEADRSVISIWRCYADCIVQVAEYCSSQPSTYQCAWVMAHLAGYYGVNWLMPIIEINGPGQAVFDELEKVRRMASDIKPHDEDYHIRNILANMRHYFYRRMDSPGGGGLAYHWRSSQDLKTRMLNQYKNGIELHRAVPRSVPLLEEMQRVVNEGGNIGGEGRSKDDRVIGAALAYQAWNIVGPDQIENARPDQGRVGST